MPVYIVLDNCNLGKYEKRVISTFPIRVPDAGQGQNAWQIGPELLNWGSRRPYLYAAVPNEGSRPCREGSR